MTNQATKATQATVEQKIATLKEAHDNLLKLSGQLATAFNYPTDISNHDNTAREKQSNDANPTTNQAAAAIRWVEDIAEAEMVADKQRSGAQEVVGDRKFLDSLFRKFSAAEDQPINSFLSLSEYVSEMGDETANEKFIEVAELLREHESFNPVKGDDIILSPEEVMARLKALKRIEEDYDAMAQFCLDEFDCAPDEAKCVYCRAAKKFEAKATFAFCMQKALLMIWEPIEIGGKYFFALVEKAKGKEIEDEREKEA